MISSFKNYRASLVAQLVKNLPAIWETWVQSLGWEDSPGEGKGYPLQYSSLENSIGCIVHGVAKSRTWLSDFHFTLKIIIFLVNIIKKIRLLPHVSWMASNKVFHSYKSLVENGLNLGSCRSKSESLIPWLLQRQVADGETGTSAPAPRSGGRPLSRHHGARGRWAAATCSEVPLTQSGRLVFSGISSAVGWMPHTDTYRLEEPATGGKWNLCSDWHRMDERRRPSISVRKDLKHLASQLK